MAGVDGMFDRLSLPNVLKPIHEGFLARQVYYANSKRPRSSAGEMWYGVADVRFKAVASRYKEIPLARSHKPIASSTSCIGAPFFFSRTLAT